MSKELYTRIIGTGSYLPPRIIKNSYFLNHEFYEPSKVKIEGKTNEEIIEKFREITNIEERRYVSEDQVTSDIAVLAIQDACKSAGISLDSLEFIIIGHNFGDIAFGNVRTNILPGLANKVKMKLNVKNPCCICHDIISGCPGWTQAMIVADSYIKSGYKKRGVVVGADVLSRISDPHDRDSMIYADGAGATIVEAVESEEPIGIIAHSSRSDSVKFANLLTLGESNNPDFNGDELFIKMSGRKLYMYAITTVPGLVKESIEKAGLEHQTAIIGIAKRLEEIFVPGDPLTLYLDKNSSGLKMIQQIRNEAHRFGISFHRNKRSKLMLFSELDQIKGIGPVSKNKLFLKTKDIKKIKEMSLAELESIVGRKAGNILFNHFHL